MKWTISISTLAVSLLLAGCATTSNTGTSSVAVNNASGYQGPAKDRVLWQYRSAVDAMRRGDFAQAKTLLDDAILSIGGTVGKDKAARQARGYFHAESKKTFIGEPYERVMAYYYRGILYWMDGEPDNARACFRSAQFTDADTQAKEYSADYVLLDYLDGLASTKLAGDGSDALQRATKETRFAKPPAYDKDSNVLFFVEFGNGPQKFATGEFAEELRFRTEQSAVRAAVIKVDNQTVAVGPYDDLNFQAITRGGRVMDHILANKAVFKSATDTIGNAGIISGAVLASQQGRNSKADEVGLGLLAFGVINKIVSSAATPAADTRYWDNLPQYLSFAATKLSPGVHTVTVLFTDVAGNSLPSLTKTLTINVPGSGDKVVFVSDKSSTPQTI